MIHLEILVKEGKTEIAVAQQINGLALNEVLDMKLSDILAKEIR